MENMNRQEALDFIMQGTRTGKLASVRTDSRPHVVPIWFVVDEDELIFNTWHKSVKARNIKHNPNVAISVDEQAPPYAFVMIEGTATLDEGTPESRLEVATKIGGRYMGQDRAEEFGQRNSVEGEYIVRVKIDKVIGKKDVAGYSE
ncbi:MAG: PPOX class F420-dependent oxidoreductase [Chloroflexi bacterium]|nr:MAG: PPOX class F420-dependent oxidoreductase [Chloroflexota bacterium]MBL1195644.1 PPOX class F420-dependent oxidoreductase [Chloroflexota bacterium]NOH12932.1 PPOX class F420-dependent oxidoreductase [Chloroflexota bacterium]